MIDNILEGSDVFQFLSGADILLFRVVLDAFQAFQTACHKGELLADVGTDACALGIIHPLQHELQHLSVGRPEILRLF